MSSRRPHVGRRAFAGLVGGAVVALAGCSGTAGSGEETSVETTGERTDETAGARRPDGTRIPSVDGAVGYTYQRRSGNRVVAGEGALPDVAPIDVSVNWTPAWVVGVSGEDAGSRWAIVGENGEVTGVRVADGEASTTDELTDELPAGVPPVLLGGRTPALVTPPAGAEEPARATHPIPVEGGQGDGGLLSVSSDGDLVLWSDSNSTDGEADRLALEALPDARIVTHGDRAFVFADATRRYDHGVLGDGAEAGSVAVVDYRGGLSEVARLRPEPTDRAVFEGIAPIVADLTGDGEREVVVTESDDERGARVVAFDAAGRRLATGPAIGHGHGWRHQLAVAPFGPDGRPELAAVRTPHVGRTAEFYRLADGDLRIVGEAPGYASHVIGSRNLDGGLAGDVDGDGRVELLVPTADRRALGAVRRSDGGADGVWTVELGGSLTTNLGAVASEGAVTVAAGRDGTVRFWPG